MTVYTSHPAAATRRGVLSALMLTLVCLVCGNAAAQQAPQQPQCGPLEKIQEVLKDQYGETPAAAMESEKGPILIFSNLETGTFTIIAMRSAEAGCVVLSGDEFHLLQQRPTQPPKRDAGS